MQGNLHFITGESSFLIVRELQRWKREFSLKFKEQGDISILTGADVRFRELLDLISTPPLFSPKRLIIVQELPTLEKSELQELARSIHPQTILLFVAVSPDRRLGLVKALLKQATVKCFDVPRPPALRMWIREEARGHGMELREESIQALIDVVGTDQWHLLWEIMKLASLGHPAPSEDDIRTVCLPGGAQAVWQLSDILAGGDTKGAFRYLEQLLQQGESPMKLWNILLWMVRQALAFSLLEESRRMGGAGSEPSDLPTGNAQTFRKLAERFRRHGPQAVARRFLDRDEALKSGKIRSSDEHPEEILAVLEREILALTT